MRPLTSTSQIQEQQDQVSSEIPSLKEWRSQTHYIPSHLDFESSYKQQQPRNRREREKAVYTDLSTLKIYGTI